MESIRELKEALTARSQTRSLEELQSGGRRRVKVIRAEHIGAMIDEAVQRAVAESGLVSRDEADRLVERSREEFATVHAERQQQADDLATARRDLEEAERRRTVLEQHVEALEEERDEALARVDGLPSASGAAQGHAAGVEPTASTATPPAAGTPQATTQPIAGGQQADALTDALEKLTSSMNDRLEKMGRKMGISGAVEADSASLDGLFAEMDEEKFESNIDSLEVKQRQSGGIAANLARLKKLKGGD